NRVHRDAELAGGLGEVLALKQDGGEAGLGPRQPIEAAQEVGRAARFLLLIADKDDRRRPGSAVGEPVPGEWRYQDGPRLGARWARQRDGSARTHAATHAGRSGIRDQALQRPALIGTSRVQAIAAHPETIATGHDRLCRAVELEHL